MSGPEHFQEAERLLAFSDERLNSAPPPAALAAAQVHATLALAAATVLPKFEHPSQGAEGVEAWRGAIT